MNDLIYDGKSLRELGFAVKHFPIHSVAERDREFVSIVGRSGDAIIDNARYKNVDMPPYEINTIDFRYLQNTDAVERKLIDWLMANDGDYKILEDSTCPGYFCKAVCTGIGEIRRNNINGYLDTTISFNREPFWYSKAGQKKITLAASETAQEITNPEHYVSEPYIKITGDGTSIGECYLIINGVSYTFDLTTEYIEIDSQKYDVFMGTTDMNVYYSSDYMPFFQPGVNTISIKSKARAWQSRLLSVEIIPRWRRL